MTQRGAEPSSSDVDAVYVFAVCGTRTPVGVEGLPGVPGGDAVGTLPFGELTAVVQTVRAADFTEEAWQARLSDRQQLERYARAHHHVVSAAAVAGPVVPLPLATLYHDEQRARSALAAETARFRAALERTADHAEWGVKVYSTGSGGADRPDPPSGPAVITGRPAERTSRPAPGAGLAYLERKRGLRAEREQRQDAAIRAAETVDAEFQKVAAAARRLRSHAPELAGDRRVQVLNATYLVAKDRTDELGRLARTLEESTGAQVELSGPWVPYSFVGEG
ncbi:MULTISPECIES: GvpL/GvpF family gas vesicle protein [unclassified Streptomyces]|uniref:GvpL/GvpF family gas vesicle protein n=1 Tax=Streptomyces TaxID=1883 RepID=UPI0001C1B1A7|nr:MULTISPECIES: GvpL/GvpF family gas vesicle protein [unclassified Streptomyces]AEN14193.1 Gas vesicle synthesis GvpLGvpF [Streptomyces sp. SirexAA-E]MYR66786.1 gas vesicle protein [Streptomyces sp. SID4939]MYS03589.1 gas vesicle protein [Streptomyces sp. SID4940]MYT65999.1 gas vesicle protein [Streptomyces sp. SID8357]MYT88925.1 gas vesicle protein [Streptomyces sp. SID8360]